MDEDSFDIVYMEKAINSHGRDLLNNRIEDYDDTSLFENNFKLKKLENDIIKKKYLKFC